MTHESAAQRRQRLGRQNGQCTWCGDPVPKGRRQWCGQDCVEAFLLDRSSEARRRAVFRRDRGVCALCRTDTERIKRLIDSFTPSDSPNRLTQTDGQIQQDLLAFYRSLGFAPYFRSMWEADHQIPRVRGGSNELNNLRTLCQPCHKQLTAELAAQRAAERHHVKKPLRSVSHHV